MIGSMPTTSTSLPSSTSSIKVVGFVLKPRKSRKFNVFESTTLRQTEFCQAHSGDHKQGCLQSDNFEPVSRSFRKIGVLTPRNAFARPSRSVFKPVQNSSREHEGETMSIIIQPAQSHSFIRVEAKLENLSLQNVTPSVNTAILDVEQSCAVSPVQLALTPRPAKSSPRKRSYSSLSPPPAVRCRNENNFFSNEATSGAPLMPIEF